MAFHQTPEAERILAGLKPLFDRARREGLWFYCNYQGLWFTPSELEAEHAKGSFIWGAVNWQLRHPEEKLGNEEAVAKSAAEQAARTRLKIQGGA